MTADMNQKARWRLALLDLDGTLYRGGAPVPGAGEFVERLRRYGVQPVFFTNNATRTPRQVADKLLSMGIVARAEEVCTAAQAAAHWLRQRLPVGARVVFIGMDGVREALAEAQLQAVHVRDAGDADCTAAEAAVMGLDRHVTYEDLARFCRLVDRLGAFVLTNPDLALPSDDGVEPGNGAFGRLVEAVTGVTPTVVGKPEPFFVEYALDRFGAHREEAFLVGDNPSTDVALGRRAGMYTIQVRTGLGQALSVTDSGADLVVDSVADLFRARIPG